MATGANYNGKSFMQRQTNDGRALRGWRKGLSYKRCEINHLLAIFTHIMQLCTQHMISA